MFAPGIWSWLNASGAKDIASHSNYSEFISIFEPQAVWSFFVVVVVMAILFKLSGNRHRGRYHHFLSSMSCCVTIIIVIPWWWGRTIFASNLSLKRKWKMQKAIEWFVKWCKVGCEQFISIYCDSSSRFDINA